MNKALDYYKISYENDFSDFISFKKYLHINFKIKNLNKEKK